MKRRARFAAMLLLCAIAGGIVGYSSVKLIKTVVRSAARPAAHEEVSQ